MIFHKTNSTRIYMYNDYGCQTTDDAVAMLERAADRTWDHSEEAVKDRRR